MKSINLAPFFIGLLPTTQLTVVIQPKLPIYELTGCTDSAHNFCKVISEHQGSKACESAQKIYLAANTSYTHTATRRSCSSA